MCGIAGMYSQATSADSVHSMVMALKHRGPDGVGVEVLPQASLGHTRLAILDIAGGHQPLHDGRRWISFNGEIYNYQELRDRYLYGRTLRTNTDTEVILHLYDLFGPHCVKLLDGMFAFAIADDRALFLARDPLGIKPLYTGTKGGARYFASEIKAIGNVVDTIELLPPGSWYLSSYGEQRYYILPAGCNAAAPPTDESVACEALRAVLRQAVIKRLMADVPVGISLSGGLDSSIVALLAREGLERVESFAVGVADSPDLIAARAVARFLGTHHHEYIYTEREMLAVLPEVIAALESCDPALVRSAIPNYLLARMAAEHVKVILTGEGADELYGGYAYLGSAVAPDALEDELAGITYALHHTNLQRADRMSMAHGLEARVPFLDLQSVELAFSLPIAWKQQTAERREKWLLRQSFAGQLPQWVTQRPKQKYSSGAGSADIIAQLAEDVVSDSKFLREQARLAQEWGYHLLNKEAYYYYDIMCQHYPDAWIFPTMGHSRSL